MRRLLCGIIVTAWIAGTVYGFSRLWVYGKTGGTVTQPPGEWPADITNVSRPDGLPTLVLLIHPRCPCSRATIGELARLMTDCNGELTATVLFTRPAGAADGWERTDLWNAAAAIPGVTVLADDAGRIAQRFGAATSGHAMLYSATGQQLFAGGITESRGHGGDNAGRAAITALVLGSTQHLNQPPALATPVYGCPLFDRADTRTKEGSQTCLN